MTQAFKPRVERKYVGTYRPRIDGMEKASGKAEYLDDITISRNFPGMLYGKVLRSPYPHAIIKSAETTKAEKLPGVHAIITFNDPEVASLKPTSHGWTSIVTTPWDRFTCIKYNDRRILDNHARWIGDETGIAVAAESDEIAEEALRLVDLEWDVLPFEMDASKSMNSDTIIHPEMNPNSNILPGEPRGPGKWDPILGEPNITKDVFLDKGDVEKGFADSDLVIEVNSSHHRADHVCLDSMGCMIYWEDDKIVCLTNSYQADQTRMMIATMLDMPLNKVRVICPYLGASMGRWNVGDQSFFIYTALLAKKAGRPVKFKHTRREDFHDTRVPIDWSCKMGTKKDGTITSAYFKGFSDVGAYAQLIGFVLKFIPLEIDHRCFGAIPNIRMEGYGVYTNKIPAGMMRSTGNIQFNLVLGLAVDELAEKLDMDPVELTIKNFGHEWGPVPNKDLETVVREGAARIGWDKRHKPAEGPMFEGSKKRGIGYSFQQGWHAEWEEELRGHNQVGVKLMPDLTVVLEAYTVETGGGSNSCNVFSCAEALGFLGVKPEDITWVKRPDTETGFKDCVQTDSAVSYLQSQLMPEIAGKIKDKILEIAVPEFNVATEELDIREGRVFLKEDPEKGMGVRDLLWKGDMVPILVTVSKEPDCSQTGVPYFCTFAEVEVDTETGAVEVLKLVQVNDCGTVMFASGAEAQLVGGQCIGMGEALTEEIIYDEATGVPLNFNLIDYKIPTMIDFPDVDPVLMEVWKGAGEYGACGIGESVFCCTPRAISNAIYNAVGVRIDDIPIKPEKVLKALNQF